MRLIRHTAALGIATAALGISTIAPVSAAPAEHAKSQEQSTQEQSDNLQSRIRWNHSVPKCARHGSLSTSGWTDHLKVKSHCGRSVWLKAVVNHGSDSRCKKVKAHKSMKHSWGYPGKLKWVEKC
ncbi:hypothetical protein G7Z12_36185 [Streptomyces sp. ID38640]|uniref:hypothetical protein n=1 Tax=Streptomyces sp. ID38640 TaxID=1265399 RepID=UPI00140F20CB|nr:hypothetical protein [Streptomyces sp. ID38640]QIK10696.1 hypothetical protein G7Z12_36185 [Streptomyces sp. ID38640]